MDPLDRLRSELADHYVVQHEIGRGGMAIVYLANDPRHSREVAIKILRPEFAVAVSAQRFLREIQIEAQLQHPNILPLFDSGEADGLPYYVMPYVAGQSLQTRLLHVCQLPLSEALHITSEVGHALAYAHSFGFVHRDVKPGNILLDGSHALLADFGIARAMTELAGDRLSESGIVVGTPEYMSPEQCAQHGNVDGRSDVYALGCVLYEMLVGEPPFTGPTAQAVVARHLSDEPRSLRVVRPSVPEHVEEAILTALAKVAADRFATATEFVSALCEDRETRKPSSNSGRARQRRTVRRRWAIVLGTAMAGLVAAQTFKTGKRLPGSGVGTPETLIMVSQFKNRSRDTLAGSLAQSLSDAVADSLAGITGLRVVAATDTALQPSDSVLGGADLAVVIAGSTERRGSQLKATGRVTDAASRVQLFSQAQQASAQELDVLQADLVERIVRFVRRYVGTETRRRAVATGTQDPIARDYWNRAMSIIDAISSPEAISLPTSAADRLAVADSLLGEAIRRDARWVGPRIARGWASLESASMFASEGQRDSARIFAHLKAVAAADTAIRIAPADPDAHELRGVSLVGLWFEAPSGSADSIGREAELELNRAISLDLDVARAWEALGTYYLFIGRFAEARQAMAQAQQADALLLSEPKILRWQIIADLNLERFSEARQTCARGARWYPVDLAFMNCEFIILGWSGRDLKAARRAWQLAQHAEARATPARRSDVYRTKLLMTAAILARAGRRDSAETLLRTFVASRQGPVDLDGFASDEAYVRLLVQQKDTALELLRTFLHNNWSQRGYIQRTPWFRSLQEDPEFITMTTQRP